MTSKETRLYFEAMPLGTGPGIVHPQRQRGGQGFYPPGAAQIGFPVIGSYGFRSKLEAYCEFQSTDLDWITYEAEVTQVDAYLRGATETIENLALVNHTLEERHLGTLGVVVDNTVYAQPTLIQENDPTVDVFGAVTLTFSSADFALLDMVLGDWLVISENVQFPTIGEIAEVIDVGTTSLSFVGREKDAFGGSKYVDASTTFVVRRLEGYFRNVAYRGVDYQKSRTYADGGFRPDLKFTFEGEPDFTRRTGIATVAATPPMGVYIGFTKGAVTLQSGVILSIPIGGR